MASVFAEKPQSHVSSNYTTQTVEVRFADGAETIAIYSAPPEVALEMARNIMRAAFCLMPPEELKAERPKEKSDA